MSGQLIQSQKSKKTSTKKQRCGLTQLRVYISIVGTEISRLNEEKKRKKKHTHREKRDNTKSVYKDLIMANLGLAGGDGSISRLHFGWKACVDGCSASTTNWIAEGV